MTVLERLKRLADPLLGHSHRDDHDVAMLELGAHRLLSVTSPSFGSGMRIPPRHAGSEGVSPKLSWSGVPPETKQLAVLCEDPDAPTAAPFVHWLAYGIEPTTKTLDEDAPRRPVTRGFKQGRNSAGGDGFTGPKPPPGDPPHQYHFEVFALDTPIDLAPGADRDSLVRAMSGHVLASGVLVGIFRA